ncbi:GATA transcription factor 15-like [Curcuma longa]|uniref:GATA transcription factor 15-like n=1 Tax=Curcuma longa TaxID=136217 RepID=UPI003D9F11F1
MLRQCGHQSSAYPCSCGFANGGSSGGTAFSFLYPVTTTKQFIEEGCDADVYSGRSSPSSVDCTLSLGTPSTRQTEHKTSVPVSGKIQRPSSCMWDILSQSKNSSMGSNASSNGGTSTLGGDPLLLARRCANCDTTSTPLWRNGPRGPKSLCNACGIRFKKEERRAAASTAPASSSPAAGEYGYHHRQHQSSWSCYASSAIKNSSSLTLYDDVADTGEAPYVPWQFNIAPSAQFPVRDRPSLFQYN